MAYTLAQAKVLEGLDGAALRRGDQLLLPSGEDRVEAGDLVLMIATTDLASRVTQYLSP